MAEADVVSTVTRHDAEIEEIRGSFKGLDAKVDRGFSDIYGKLDRIINAISGIGRTDTKTILQAIALIVAGFGATVAFVSVIGSMALGPLIHRINDHEAALSALSERSTSNRMLTIQANEILRGALIEQERQINTVERIHIAEIRGMQAAINASLIARDMPPIPFAELLDPMQTAQVPELLSNSNGH